MHVSRPALAVSLFAALAAASSAGARPGSTVNVCRLLTAKQVAAVPGVSSACTNAKPMAGPGSTIYSGNWRGKTATSARLQVTVSSYTDQGMLALAKRNLKQGLPGTPRKVVGIGNGAYEATGAGSEAIHVAIGKYVVAVVVNTSGKLPRTAVIEAVAREIAARL